MAAADPLRIFIRTGPKTHRPGQHDYPQFQIDWKKLLAERGVKVDGGERPPTAAELERTDVLIIFKGDESSMKPEDKKNIEAFVKRGGGMVLLHDALCGSDPTWLAGITGGAKTHGQMNWRAGTLKEHFVDTNHPITKGMKDFEIADEMFFLLTTDPAMKPLMTTDDPTGKQVPQLWTVEKKMPGGKTYRSVTFMQGHNYSIFSNPDVQTILLRSIAWAGDKKVDLLIKK
jgi:type 1 glutamine amidotransferase